MTNFKDSNAALDFAIQNEQEAADFYLQMAERATSAGMKAAFKGFAAEEQGHKKKLLSVKTGRKLLSSERKVQDLKISDYLIDVKPHDDMNYQEILIMVMKKEKAAYKLYIDLAASTEDSQLRDVFLGLAQEEASHKLRFETEYDDEIYREN